MSKELSLLFYICIYLFSAFLLWESKKSSGKRTYVYFFIAVAIPVVLAAIRKDVGTDYRTYLNTYKRVSNLTFAQWFHENADIDGTPFGVWLFSKIAYYLGGSAVFFGLMALACYLPIALTIKREYSSEVTIPVAFLFLTTTFSLGLNGMKQGAAIGIIVYSLKYVHNRNIIKFLLCVLVAMLFHITAAVSILIYFLWTPKDQFFSFRKTCILAACVVGIMIYPTILTMMGGRWASYVNYEGMESSNRMFFLELLFLCIFIVFRKKLVAIDFRNNLLIFTFAIGGLFEIVGFASPFVKRIALYYTFVQYLLLAQLPKVFVREERGYVKMGVCAYAVVLFTLIYYVLGQARLIPFQSIF